MDYVEKEGIIKEVKSADTYIISLGESHDAEKQTVCLASIAAPRPAYKSTAQENGYSPDEPYGFNAREHMRKQLIGQKVTFKIEYEFGGREYGWIKVNGVSLSHHILRNGYAKLRNNLNPPQASDIDILQDFQFEAQNRQVGVWNPYVEHFVREPYFIERDQEATTAFANRNMNKRFPVVIEYIRDGGSFNVYAPHEEAYISVQLNGVYVDGFRRREEGEVVEPLAVETKQFVENLVFQREGCVLRVEGSDSFGNVQGSLYTPKGSLSVLLLGGGFARLNENSVKNTENPSELRSAAVDAMNKQLRRWKGFTRNVAETDDAVEYTTSVIEVLSGDVIIVKAPCGKEERRLYLASIKAPRLGVPAIKRAEEPYSWEAKEFMRKKLIGKPVTVRVDYTRVPTAGTAGAALPPASDSKGRLHFVSLQVDEKNPVIEMLKKGLAEVNEVRRIEDDRAADYDAYLEAQAAAVKAGAGLHGNKEKYSPKHTKMIDLTAINAKADPKAAQTIAARAKAYEKDFRDGSYSAIVEHVANAGRYRLRVPDHNVIISCILGGVRCPAAPNNAGQGGEPFGADGRAFAREFLLQQEVTISVETVDKGGNFIASVRAPKIGDVAEAILRRGLARTSEFGAERPHLAAAEKEAKTKKLGVQTLIDEEAEAAKKAAVAAAFAEIENLDENIGEITLSHVVNIDEIYINRVSRTSESDLVFDVCDKAASDAALTGALSVGDAILAIEENDGLYYRAIISARQPGDRYKINYVDIGASGVVHVSKTRALPSEISLTAVLPLAEKVALAGVKAAASVPAFETADAIYSRFEDIAGPSAKAYATVVRNIAGKLHVIIRSSNFASYSQSLNAALLQNGECFIDRDACNKMNSKIVEALNSASEIAKNNMLGVFQFGDIEEEEEKRGGFARRR